MVVKWELSSCYIRSESQHIVLFHKLSPTNWLFKTSPPMNTFSPNTIVRVEASSHHLINTNKVKFIKKINDWQSKQHAFLMWHRLKKCYGIAFLTTNIVGNHGCHGNFHHVANYIITLYLYWSDTMNWAHKLCGHELDLYYTYSSGPAFPMGTTTEVSQRPSWQVQGVLLPWKNWANIWCSLIKNLMKRCVTNPIKKTILWDA